MNDQKLKKLFEAMREDKSPLPRDSFDARVMSGIRREQKALPPTVWEQLGQLFPRLATAAIAAMALVCLADICHSALYPENTKSDVEELSEQWLFANNGGVNE